MFISTYIPVNVNRTNCAVYSESKVFPRERLLAAKDKLLGNNPAGVVMEEGIISFIDDKTIQWTIAEVYLASETLRVAEENDFGFYMIKDHNNIPQLFVSKSFKRSRILINAFNMQSVLLTKPQLVSKAASVIDKTFDTSYCSYLFNTLRDIENGAAKFLNAVLLYKDTVDEVMCVNPLTTLMSDITTFYPVEVMNDLRKVYEDKSMRTDTIVFENNRFRRVDTDIFEPMRENFVKDILEMYDKVRSRKSNYIPLVDETCNTRLYFSTNHRYLVNAATFECVIIKNQHTKSLLECWSTKSVIPRDQLELVWMLAKTE